MEYKPFFDDSMERLSGRIPPDVEAKAREEAAKKYSKIIRKNAMLPVALGPINPVPPPVGSGIIPKFSEKYAKRYGPVVLNRIETLREELNTLEASIIGDARRRPAGYKSKEAYDAMGMGLYNINPSKFYPKKDLMKEYNLKYKQYKALTRATKANIKGLIPKEDLKSNPDMAKVMRKFNRAKKIIHMIKMSKEDYKSDPSFQQFSMLKKQLHGRLIPYFAARRTMGTGVCGSAMEARGGAMCARGLKKLDYKLLRTKGGFLGTLASIVGPIAIEGAKWLGKKIGEKIKSKVQPKVNPDKEPSNGSEVWRKAYEIAAKTLQEKYDPQAVAEYISAHSKKILPNGIPAKTIEKELPSLKALLKPLGVDAPDEPIPENLKEVGQGVLKQVMRKKVLKQPRALRGMGTYSATPLVEKAETYSVPSVSESDYALPGAVGPATADAFRFAGRRASLVYDIAKKT